MSLKGFNIFVLIFLFSFVTYPGELFSGKVIDCKTGLPLMGAEILINNPENIDSKVAISDFDGFFEIKISKKIKEIIIKYPKYKDYKINIGKATELGEIILFKRGCKKNF